MLTLLLLSLVYMYFPVKMVLDKAAVDTLDSGRERPDIDLVIKNGGLLGNLFM